MLLQQDQRTCTKEPSLCGSLLKELNCPNFRELSPLTFSSEQGGSNFEFDSYCEVIFVEPFVEC